MMGLAVPLEDECIAQHLADGARFDVGTLRRDAPAAPLIPVGEQLAIGRVFHCYSTCLAVAQA
jgi:hypothetical protein